MTQPKLHHEYDTPDDPGIDCTSMPSMTKQADKDACDINLILERALRNGGILDAPQHPPPFYGDFADPIDYQAAQDILIAARDHFAGLDAKLRERFSNDPLRLLQFLDNAENLDEAVRLGLVTKTIQPATTAVTVPPGTVLTQTLKTTDTPPADQPKT